MSLSSPSGVAKLADTRRLDGVEDLENPSDGENDSEDDEVRPPLHSRCMARRSLTEHSTQDEPPRKRARPDPHSNAQSDEQDDQEEEEEEEESEDDGRPPFFGSSRLSPLLLPFLCFSPRRARQRAIADEVSEHV